MEGVDDLSSIVLLLAAVTSGLDAGVFVLYAHTVMPGLARTDDRTFVAAFQAIDRAIINPWFMLGAFFGGPALTAAGDPDGIDVAAVRAAFDEARWVRWNLVRVVTATGSFALLCWALLLHGAHNLG